MFSVLKLIRVIVPCLLVIGCGGGSSGGSAVVATPAPCSVDGQKQTVLERMQDIYFWNDEAEQQAKYRGLDVDSFADAETLLGFLRYRPDDFDRGFTFLTTAESETQFFGEGVFVGFGFSFELLPGDELRIKQVFAGSPAEAAGFARGFRILEVDGRTIAAIQAAEGLNEVFGPPTPGFSLNFLIEDLASNQFPTVAAKAEVTIDPLPQHRVINAVDKTIGYLEFRTFISTSNSALLEAFAEFTAQGVTDVIVDLRYNGGGLVSVAEFTASLLAGPANVSRVLSMTRFNRANRAMDETSRFSSESNSIDLDSIVFITTDDSASASELVINSLEPYINVALIGSNTFGKPVGQLASDFCGQRLRAVAFETVNANEEGQYFDGLPVDCDTADDLNFAIGDPAEASLAAAITYVSTGACPAIQTASRKASELQSMETAARMRPHRPAGPIWREYAGAY
ncbi:MAG: S41 family peptidase [Gammaproteobacteria bacterium]|nr:S41 family peptidase [Gammaproteobacteria bacterium]